MKNIQLKISNKIRRFENNMKDLTTFAQGSDLGACTKAYKLYIRIVNAGVKYDISVRMRTQLKVDTGYLEQRQITTSRGGTTTVNTLR